MEPRGESSDGEERVFCQRLFFSKVQNRYFASFEVCFSQRPSTKKCATERRRVQPKTVKVASPPFSERDQVLHLEPAVFEFTQETPKYWV